MNVIVDKKFYKSLPKYLYEKIEKIILEIKKDSQSIFTHGKFTRKIKNTLNKFKFRISDGNRIVFQYEKDSTIRLLRFCTHDEQIRVAERIEPKEIHILKDEYIEDAFDYHIDQEIENEIKNGILEDRLEDVLNEYDNMGALSSNKAKTIKKVLNISAFRNEFISSKEFISTLHIHAQGNHLGKKELAYALNRLFSETRYTIFPFMYISIVNTGIYKDFFYNNYNSTSKQNLTDISAAIFDEIGELKEWPRLELLCILINKNNLKVDSKFIDINTYQKTINISEGNQKIKLDIEKKLTRFAANIRLERNKPSIAKSNINFIFNN